MGNVFRDDECGRQLPLGYERGALGSRVARSGGDAGTIFYADFASGTGDYMATSASLGTINCGSLTQPRVTPGSAL